jgi:hypothetical protein
VTRPEQPQTTACPTPRGQPRWLAATLVLWGIVVAAGFWSLWSYAAAPGAAETAPPTWPAASALPRTAGRWTLVMFVHPKCPCTRASLTELEKLQAHAPQIDLRIVAILPDGTDAGWSDSPLIRRAKELPNSLVIGDHAGYEARQFRARTSGETQLYDQAGSLAYHGGITAARGHEGDNPGCDAIAALLAGKTAPASCPVFGCPLFSDRPQAREATP